MNGISVGKVFEADIVRVGIFDNDVRGVTAELLSDHMWVGRWAYFLTVLTLISNPILGTGASLAEFFKDKDNENISKASIPFELQRIQNAGTLD